jgi:primosomal protein N''
VLKPLIVLDGGPDKVFANHRRNLSTYLNEARQKMYSIREELEK